MKSNIHGHGNQVKVDPNWFTGRVWIKDLSSVIGSTDNIYHVHFMNGARTKLHRHDGGQTLIVTSGRGSLALFQGKNGGSEGIEISPSRTVSLVKGDVTFIPAGILHAHGSTGDEEFSHIAINRTSGGKYNTDWYESDLKSRASRI